MKIALLLAVLIFSVSALFMAIYIRQNKRAQERALAQESVRTMRSLAASVSAVLENADSCSKLILSDGQAQRQMESGSLFGNLAEQSSMVNHIYSMLQLYPSVSSVWLIDHEGQRLRIGAGSGELSSETGYQKSLERLRRPYGEPELIIGNTEEGSGVSLVRSYTSLTSFTSLGLLGVDLDPAAMHRYLVDVIGESQDEIRVLDADGVVLYQEGTQLSPETASDRALGGKDYVFWKKDGRRYLLSQTTVPRCGWRIVRASHIDQSMLRNENLRLTLLMIVFLGIVIFAGAYGVAFLLIRPIRALLVSMQTTENGKLCKVKERSPLVEFRYLFEGYNEMVDRIESLIREIIDTQKRIRRIEFNEMQEQMKPHFLYNTLDAIEALAMMKDTDKVCQLVESLGVFYRKSVSGGKEFLTVEEEMEIAEKYAAIMRIRVGEGFNCHISMDEESRQLLIPKLTIQPLVENSFQHGIRSSSLYGMITVNASVENRKLHIMVRDNGEGIPQEVVRELEQPGGPAEHKSLGLRGTVERLRLIYQEHFSYRIVNQGFSEVHLYLDEDVCRETGEDNVG